MQRLQSFLPAMQQSTNELQQRAEVDPTGLDIEHLNPETQEYIEMVSIHCLEIITTPNIYTRD